MKNQGIYSSLENQLNKLARHNRQGSYRTKEIINSLKIPWTNGFIVGCNNKTKVLNRTCYGMRNFNNFRKRILFCNS